MNVAIIPLLFAIVGLLIFVLARTNPDLKRIGEHLMWTSFLVTLMSMAGHVVHLF